ncbi:carbon-nitrogen hydrolase [Halochromatium roseum]|uniref:carbon-nitrogen hydrolase n=1 Tax=Halochromatium roseum TaxID=391920 RepID=UPI001912BE65|nr:carbon-nitrogen hydrolase [Halochromatium roseum]MBK5937995.1 acyltransferase [Halochromatium roseum]
MLKIALVQASARLAAPCNPESCQGQLERAKANGCRLVLLPELHNGSYFCQTEDSAQFDRAEPIPGPTTDWLGSLAAQHRMVIVGSVFERRGPGVYHNTAVVLDADGSLAGVYRKMHIPDDPGFYEKFYFTPGDLGFEPIETAAGRLGVLVCWDQWFPEAARLMALAGAELLLYPTAIGWDPQDDAAEQARQLDAWMTVQRGHAIANGLPLLACNRVGFEPSPAAERESESEPEPEPEPRPKTTATGTSTETGTGTGTRTSTGIQFWGNSFICGPQGEILAQAPTDDEQLLIAEIDLARTEQVRRIWPFLRDRRIDAYADLLKRWRD